MPYDLARPAADGVIGGRDRIVPVELVVFAVVLPRRLVTEVSSGPSRPGVR